MSESETVIRTIASEIMNQTIWENYKFYLLVFAISLVSGAIVAFSVPYLKQRGKNLATKADFEEILRQLKLTTTLAEGIKSDINLKLEEEHNIRALSREKMEALFEQTFELELWLEQAREKAKVGLQSDNHACPIAKIEMYQLIYFKEIIVEMVALKIATFEMMVWILRLADKVSETKTENISKEYLNNLIVTDEFRKLQAKLEGALNNFRSSVIEKYSPKLGL